MNPNTPSSPKANSRLLRGVADGVVVVAAGAVAAVTGAANATAKIAKRLSPIIPKRQAPVPHFETLGDEEPIAVSLHDIVCGPQVMPSADQRVENRRRLEERLKMVQTLTSEEARRTRSPLPTPRSPSLTAAPHL